MKQNILLAQDIDSNQKSIAKQIEENTIIFNKLRLKKELKQVRDKLKIEFPDNAELHILSKQQISDITNQLIHDEECNEYRENQKEVLTIKKDNYYLLRETLYGLNDLNEFSAEIERNEIQRIDHFLKYEPLLEFSLTKLKIFQKIAVIRKDSINSNIKLYKDKKLPFNTSKAVESLSNNKDNFSSVS